MTRHLITAWLLICLSSLPVWAADHYVSPTGTATWENSADIGQPCSIATAFTNAAAGDMVYFRGGTYSIPAHTSSDTYSGVYNFAASGTGDAEANRIVFRAYTGETPVFDGTMTGSGEGHCYATLIGTAGYDYITIDGFTFQTDSGAAQARIHIGSGNSDNHSEYVKIQNCIFDGGSAACSDQDNNEGIRFDFTDHCTVSNCTIYNYRYTTLNGYRGIGAIKSYTGTYLTVENCEIYNCSHGIYGKSYNDHHVYRYNYIHDVGDGINYSTNAHYATNGSMYHNIITNFSYTGIYIYGRIDDTVTGWTVYNNTLYSTTATPTEGPLSILGYESSSPYDSGSLYNNILVGPSGTGTSTTARVWYSILTSCDYNNYGTTFATYFGEGGSQNTLSGVQGSAACSLAIGAHDMNSVATNPTFSNASGNLNLVSDFALTSLSAGYHAGSDGKDMGADVSLVGPGAEEEEEPALQPTMQGCSLQGGGN